MKKRLMAMVVAVTVAIGVGAFGFGSPAMATSTSCSTIAVNPTCTTGVIPANASGHFLDYSAGGFSFISGRYSIKDLNTGVIVKQGSFTLPTSGRVPGLYGTRYQMTVRCDCLASGTIDNS